MKSAFLLLAGLGFAVLTNAQTPTPAAVKNQIDIIVTNDSTVTIAFLGKMFAVRSNAALDSCLQKIIPNANHPSILLDLPNDMDEEKRRAIGIILEKFHLPVMGFRKFEPTKSAQVRRLDTAGH